MFETKIALSLTNISPNEISMLPEGHLAYMYCLNLAFFEIKHNYYAKFTLESTVYHKFTQRLQRRQRIDEEL